MITRFKYMGNWRMKNIHESSWKSFKVFEKSIKGILYIQDLSLARVLWFTYRVGDLTLTAPLTRHWCFISWQEVTDLAPGRHGAVCQGISVCSQGGSNYGQSDVWFLLCQKLAALLHLCCTTWKLMRLCRKHCSEACLYLERSPAASVVSLVLITWNTIRNLLQAAMSVTCSIFHQASRTALWDVAQGVFMPSIKSLSSRWGAWTVSCYFFPSEWAFARSTFFFVV